MEAVQELALQRFVGFLVQLASLERGLGLGELGADPGRVVELRLGLVDDLLEHPDAPGGRREGRGEDAADHPHQAPAGMASRTKLYGGSGPTSLKWSGGERREASSSTCFSTDSTAPRSTSNARSNAASSLAGSPTTTSRAIGPSASRTRDRSYARRAASASPTASPSAMPASTDGETR